MTRWRYWEIRKIVKEDLMYSCGNCWFIKVFFASKIWYFLALTSDLRIFWFYISGKNGSALKTISDLYRKNPLRKSNKIWCFHWDIIQTLREIFFWDTLYFVPKRLTLKKFWVQKKFRSKVYVKCLSPHICGPNV